MHYAYTLPCNFADNCGDQQRDVDVYDKTRENTVRLLTFGFSEMTGIYLVKKT